MWVGVKLVFVYIYVIYLVIPLVFLYPAVAYGAAGKLKKDRCKYAAIMRRMCTLVK